MICRNIYVLERRLHRGLVTSARKVLARLSAAKTAGREENDGDDVKQKHGVGRCLQLNSFMFFRISSPKIIFINEPKHPCLLPTEPNSLFFPFKLLLIPLSPRQPLSLFPLLPLIQPSNFPLPSLIHNAKVSLSHKSFPPFLPLHNHKLHKHFNTRPT